MQRRVMRRLNLSDEVVELLDRITPAPLELGARLILLDCPGFGDLRLNKLVDKFDSASEILSTSASEIARIRGIGRNLCTTLTTHHPAYFASSRFWSDLETVYKRGARLVLRGERGYPRSLTTLSVPPPLLWVSGDHCALEQAMVSVVGTRKATPGGRKSAYDLGYALAAEGYTVVSGLAYGIDAEAHRGALDAGGRTVAVLGSGLLRMYPYTHRGLSERILESGAIVSEFPLHTGAKPGHFPRRNRIISGLSVATVIIEAYEKGGALITGRLALDQNREVFAFPGDASSAASRGTNNLIRSGEAGMVLTVDEVLSEVNTLVGRKSLLQNHMKKDVTDLKTSSEQVLVNRERSERTRGRRISLGEPSRVLEALSTKAVHVNELTRHDNGPLRLLRLENAGLVRRLPGGYYIKTGQKK